MNSKSIKVIVIALVVIIIVFAIWEFAIKGQSTDKKSETMTPTSTPMPSEASPSAAASYKDGTYKATGHYQNPDRIEAVNVTLTIKDGKVTDVNFVGSSDAAPTTKFMQNNFKDGYKDLVVGKPIDEISMDVVNGSSLTPKGFMDALKQIKAQARA
ncbi:MAG TPA: FMN-binding protein [Patescibacteria group bacterium]|nr:FMN-binding protein [Patescibacteria group bacterium]